MEDLLILTNLINKQTSKNIELINSNFKKSQKQYLLYENILDGKIKNDIDGSKILFEGDPKNPAYIKLKYRLKQRLLNTLFFIDLNKAKHSDYNKAKIESFKDWATINLLLNRSARAPAIKICHTLLNLSVRYEFTDLQILICRILTKHYGFIDINKTKFLKYEKLMFERLEIYYAELKSESYYNQVSHLHFENRRHNKIDSILQEYTSILKELKDKFGSFTINYNYYQLEYYKYFTSKDYNTAKQICADALDYFKKTKANSGIAEYLFRKNLHSCLLQLGELNAAKKLIQLNIKTAKQGGHNWFGEWHHYFIWAATSNNKGEMLKAVSTVLSNPQTKKTKLVLELWKVKEAYIQILLSNNIITNKTSKYKLKSFSLGKFLNEVPNYSKDKKGLNISILIAHLLFLLTRKKYDAMLLRIDSLRQYSHRYLRNDHTFRSNCFIKMLCKIPDANYHPIALKRHTKKLYEKLSTTTYSYSDNPAEIEVIPYENLWEIVLEILAKNQKKS